GRRRLPGGDRRRALRAAHRLLLAVRDEPRGGARPASAVAGRAHPRAALRRQERGVERLLARLRQLHGTLVLMSGTFTFESRQPVRWVDVDAAGVVNHAVWLTLVEQARFEYFAGLGLLHGDVPPFLLGATSVRYERPGRFGMEIVVLARTSRLGGR